MTRIIRLTLLAIVFLLFSSPAIGDNQVKHLKKELAIINQEIQAAEAQDANLKGGLIKALVQTRIELLKTNAALVQQRIHALESGAKVTIKLSASKPDPKRAAHIKEEIDSVKKEIVDKKAESAQYRGGLVKAMIESSIATMYNTVAMLETEYLKGKYGIYWIPSLREEKGATSEASAVEERRSPVTKRDKEKFDEKDKQLLIPTLTNKRFQESDFLRRIYEDAIWFDVSWDTSNLRKPTRAVKGILIIGDIFGEPKLHLRWTINDPLSPRKKHEQDAVGFEYNQFNSAHKWVRATELKDMTFRFEVTDIIYQDGSTEKFK